MVVLFFTVPPPPGFNASLLHRTSTARSRCQCSPPELKSAVDAIIPRQIPMAVFPDGSVPRWTPTASAGWQCMSDRWSEFMSERRSESVSNRMSKFVTDIICQKVCQMNCHNLCQISVQVYVRSPSELMPDRRSESMLNRMSEFMSDRMSVRIDVK